MFHLLLSIWLHSTKLHHQTHYFYFLFRSSLACLLVFISFSVKCASSALSLWPPSPLLNHVPIIWMGISCQSRSSDFKCCDQLYLLPHESQREDNLYHTTMGRTVNIFQACCSKETDCPDNRYCRARRQITEMDQTPRQNLVHGDSWRKSLIPVSFTLFTISAEVTEGIT